MEINRKFDLDVKKTVEKSVGTRSDFHFHVDELDSKNFMQTYVGNADEKYSFDEMNDEFFEFLKRKAQGDGIYIRLVFACAVDSNDDEAAFKLEYGDESEIFKTRELDKVLEFEFADFGVKLQNGEITFGATVEDGCGKTPFFAPFGSNKANKQYLSCENPLNRHVLSIMEKMIL